MDILLNNEIQKNWNTNIEIDQFIDELQKPLDSSKNNKCK